MEFDFDKIWDEVVKLSVKRCFNERTANDTHYKEKIRIMVSNLLKIVNSKDENEPLRYDIAVSFTIAMVKNPPVGATTNKSLFENCKLAFEVGIDILRSYTCTYEEKNGDKTYAEQIKNKYIYISDSFEKQLIYKFYWSLKHDGYRLNNINNTEPSGIFFISSIFQLIENLSKTLFIIESAKNLTQANNVNIPNLTEILNTKLMGLEFHS